MEVILLKNFSSLGDAGDIVDVKPGYARNMLIPQGIALRATNKNLSVMEEKKKLSIIREKRENTYFEDIAKKLSKLEITIEVKVGESISLQKHHHRSEHWIIVKGTAQVEIDDSKKLIFENQKGDKC